MQELRRIDHSLNNFDFLRLLAASMVVVSHSFDLLSPADNVNSNGEPLKAVTQGKISLGTLGVAIFFCLSGYLITQSLFRSTNYRTYFIKRFLRIFPALILDLLVAVFIWGAVVTSLSLYQYFTDPLTYQYLLNIRLYPLTYVLPGVFETNIYGNTVNGSLWTLPYEFTCYVGIAMLHFVFVLKNKYVYAGAYLLYFTIGNYLLSSGWRDAVIPYLDLSFSFLFTLSMYFGAGALFYHFQDKISYKWSIALGLLVLMAIGNYFYLVTFTSYFCLPYLVFWFVFEKRIGVSNVGKYGDFSYGMYIYAFPVQQTIAHFIGE